MKLSFKNVVLFGMIFCIITLSSGCIDETDYASSQNNSQDYQKVESDCPEDYVPSLYSDTCQSFLKNGSWVPTLIFDSDVSDSSIKAVMERYFGEYDNEWQIFNFSSKFPHYLKSPKGKYNYYTSQIKENWELCLNCHYGCYDEGIFSFEKERGDYVILGLDNCRIKYKNCFEEMKKAGIPVKKTKCAFPRKYRTNNSDVEMINLLKEIDKDEEVLFVMKSYINDR
jgi:hypothetical protein